MSRATHRSLYQINTRILINETAAALGRPATLDDVPDAYWDSVSANGFDYVWLLGVWKTGAAGRAVSRSRPEWIEEYRRVLPDLREEDVTGSPFAIHSYSLNSAFGLPDCLRRTRERLAARRLKLILDFVPNHMGLDHPWIDEHPEYFVAGDSEAPEREPANYVRVNTKKGPTVFAHGRDPYFPGWPDTLQLNYRHSGLRNAMAATLDTLASVCDGVRCDMAMLLLSDVFQRTWGDRSLPDDGTPPVDASFWKEAIDRTRRVNPDFVFIAEAYWDLEWRLQQEGFNYTYDKRLYDRLRDRSARAAREHLWADPDYQNRSVRFLENHDEPRAAEVFDAEAHRAAAVISFLLPGLRFFHEGQLAGRSIRTSIHLGRRAVEPEDSELSKFYRALLPCVGLLEAREGAWKLLTCRAAWEGNPTFENFLTFTWEHQRHQMLVCVNYGPAQGQCYMEFPPNDLTGGGGTLELRDLVGNAVFERSVGDLLARGLYLDMPAWGYHVFEVSPI